MLKAHIQNSGATREAWAGRLGISRSYLSLLESGDKTPSLSLAIRIERLTGGAVPAASWIAEDRDADCSAGRAADRDTDRGAA